MEPWLREVDEALEDEEIVDLVMRLMRSTMSVDLGTLF